MLIILLGSLTALGPLSIDMYLPAFPEIARDLEVDAGAIQLTLATYLLGAGLFQLVYGPVSDRLGRRLPLLVGIGVFVIGTIACMIAESVGVLTAARLVQALGGAAGMVITRSIVRDLFNERESAKMFSELMLVMGLAPILAPTLGSQIVAMGSWRLIFAFLAVFSAMGFVFAYFWLPETLPRARRLAGGMSATVQSFRDPLTSRHFIGYVLVIGFLSGLLFSYVAGGSFVFMELHGLSPRQFGILFGANAMGLICAAQVNRWLLGRYTGELLLSMGVLSAALAGNALLICTLAGWGGLFLPSVLMLMALMSLGFSFPNLAAAALSPFGRAAGGASALMGTIQFLLGGAAGAAVGLLHNGTAIPMAASIAACGTIGFVLLHTVARKSLVAGMSGEYRVDSAGAA